MQSRQVLEAQSHLESSNLKQRIIELEAETEEQRIVQQQLEKRLAEMESAQTALRRELGCYQEEVRGQAGSLQQQVEERDRCITMLESQLNMLGESNGGLSLLLRKENAKVVELMRELTEKNRLIKEYIEERGE